MSDTPREHPSTYFVQDRDNHDELTRLQAQDHMITASMGGVLSEQPDPTRFKRILDIGCGPGGWLIDTAKAYPSITQLFGVDISGKMLDYARNQAMTNGVSDRVEFVIMDALRMLEFPNNFFDLVNMRLAQSWIRTWEWPKLLQEALRVCKPGSIIRFTEGCYGQSTSVALNRFDQIGIQALHRAGYYFTPESDAILTHLPRLMHQHGVQNVQTRAYTFECRAGTPEGLFFAENVKLVYRVGLPFLKKWIRIPDDYEDIYQQALLDMQTPGFVVTWNQITAWGNK